MKKGVSFLLREHRYPLPRAQAQPVGIPFTLKEINVKGKMDDGNTGQLKNNAASNANAQSPSGIQHR